MKRWRRRAQWLAVAAIVGFVSLHSRPVQELVRRAVVSLSSSAIQGAVEIETFRYRLWSGDIELSGFHLVPGSMAVPAEIAAERIEIHLTPAFRLAITARGLDVALIDVLDAPSGHEALALPLRISSAQTEGARLRFLERDISGKLEERLSFADVSVTATARGDELSVALGAGEARVQGIPFGSLEADVSLSPAGPSKTMSILSVAMEKGDSFLRGEGDLRFGEERGGELALRFSLDSTLAKAIPVTSDLELEGVITGEGRVGIEESEPRIEASFLSEKLRLGEIVVQEVSGSTEIGREGADISTLTAKLFGGSATLAGHVSFRDGGETRIEASIGDVNVRPLAAALRQPSLSGRLGGHAAVVLSDWNEKAVRGEVALRLHPLRYDESLSAQGELRAKIDAGVLRFQPSTLHLAKPRGRVALEGTMTTAGELDLGLEAGLEELPAGITGALKSTGRLRGTVSEPLWEARVEGALLVAEEELGVRGKISGTRTAATVETLTLTGASGSLVASGRVPLEASGTWDLEAVMRELELPSFGPTDGVASGTLRVSGPARDPDGTASVRIAPFFLNDAEGEGTLVASKRGLTITVEEARASIGDASIDASGSYRIDTELLQVTAQGQGLTLAQLAPSLDPDRLEGNLSFDTEFEGTRDALEGEASLRIDSLALRGCALPALRVEAFLDGRKVTFTGLREDGIELVRGSLPLTEPYEASVRVLLEALPWNELASSLKSPALEGARIDADGVVDAVIPLTEPARIRYSGRIGSIHGDVKSGSFRTGPFTFEGGKGSVTFVRLRLEGRNSFLELDGTLPLNDEEQFGIRVQSRASLEALVPFALDLEASGEVDIEVEARGTWTRPDVSGRVSIEGSEGRWEHLRWSDLTLSGDIDRERIRNLVLEADVSGGRARLQGELPFAPRREDKGRVRLSVQDVDVAALLLPERETEVRLTLDGNLEASAWSLDGLGGSGTIEMLVVRHHERSVAADAAAPWSLSSGRFALGGLRIRGEGSAVEARVEAWELGAEPRFDASVKGEVDIEAVASLLETPRMQVGGLAELELTARSGDSGLELSGRGTVKGGRLQLLEPAFELSDATALVELLGSEARISGLSARSGTGRLTGMGVVDWTEPGSPRVNADLRAASVPLDVLRGLRTELSGELRLQSETDGFLLSGELSMDRGVFTREFDDQETAFAARGVALRDRASAGGPLDRLSLNLGMVTRTPLVVENSKARLEATGSISVTGSASSPELGGFVNLTPLGTVQVGRNRFEMRQGRVDLTGAPLAPPHIEAVAVTRVGSTTIQIDVAGEADDLRTRLSSPDRPDLTEGDLTSLLVTGRTLENAAQGGQQMASSWMMSSLADLVHEGLGDFFSFGPPPGAGPLVLAEEADPTSRLTVGVPLSERLSITYSIALDDTERRLWILDYRLARNFWIRGIQENSNDYAVGISHRLEVDFKGERRDALLREENRIANVTLQGVPSDRNQKLRIERGDRYDYWRAREAAAAIQRSLVQAGYPSALVDLNVDNGEDGEVELTYLARPGKPIDIVWEGDDPGRDVRESVLSSWDGRVPLAILLPELARKARASLKRRRYYLAQVKASTEEGAERDRAIFEVERGPKGKDVEVSFEGNDALSDEEIRAALPPADSLEFVTLLEQSSELERGIRLKYASAGYLDASVRSIEQRYDEKTRVLSLQIHLDEGALVHVTSIEFEGGGSIESARLRNELGFDAGKPVSFPAIGRGETRIRTLFRNEGFSDVRLRSEVTRRSDGIAVTFRIDEGLRIRVGSIRVLGTVRTRPDVVRGQLTFREYDPVRVIDFQESQKRLYDLGIFRSADIRMDASQRGREVQDVLVQVVERADLDLNYGLRYNFVGSEQSIDSTAEPEAKGFEAVAGANLVNAFGRGSNVGLTAFFQDRQYLYRLTSRFPSFLSRRMTTELFFETKRETEIFGSTEFSLRREAATFQQTKRLTDSRTEKFSLQWNFQFARYEGEAIDRAGSLLTVATNRPRFGFSVIEDRRDSFANPANGRFWNVTLQVVPEIWGSSVSYYRLYGQFFYYKPLFGSMVWASGYRAGIARGSEDVLVIDDRFQAGGANSIRGFGQNSLGPSVTEPETGKRYFLGGQAVGVFNQELRFPLYKSLAAGVFWDAGNVFARARDFELGNFRHSVGAGIRYLLSFGAVRLDWARVLNPREGDLLVDFHFSFGMAF